MPLDSVRAQLVEVLLDPGSRLKGQFPDQGGVSSSIRLRRVCSLRMFSVKTVEINPPDVVMWEDTVVG
jgi:hypothetical protein